jgi:hypothetical protein
MKMVDFFFYRHLNLKVRSSGMDGINTSTEPFLIFTYILTQQRISALLKWEMCFDPHETETPEEGPLLQAMDTGAKAMEKHLGKKLRGDDDPI